MVLMQKPSVIDSPSSRVPTKAPRWDLADTEGYGGRNCVSWCSQMFSGSVDIYRRKKYVGGCPWGPRDRGRALQGGGGLLSRGALGGFLTGTPSSPDQICSKINVPEGFIPFGLRLIFLFFEIPKQAKKQQYGLGLRLVGQSQKLYKCVK